MLDLAVHILTKLNRSTLLVGKESIILPCLGRTEADIQESGQQFVTVEDSMSMVHASKGNLPPASKSCSPSRRSWRGIAVATLPETKVHWLHMVADYDRIRDAIEAVFPDFKDYNKRVRVPGGFRLPLPATERVWKTAVRQGRVPGLSGPERGSRRAANGVFRLTTIRSHDQYNTTMYGQDDRYRGVFGRRDVVFMSKADIAAQKLEHGDVVDIETALPGWRAQPGRGLYGDFL